MADTTGAIHLRGCPFCGRQVAIDRAPYTGLRIVYCDHCGARVSFEPASVLTDKATADAWNRRAQ